MKKHLLLAAVMLLTIAAISQSVLYEDDFESYPAGEYMAVVNPDWWATWSNAPGTGEDIRVSDNFAYSGTRSAFITWEDGITDALLKLGDKTSGVYELDWKMYIESGYGAYYNLQHFEEPGVEWAFEVYFWPDETGEFKVGDESYGFHFDHDTWFSVHHLFNIDDDLATIVIDDEEIHTWPFHYETYSTEGTNQLGAVNFNDGTNFRYYVDDIEYDSLETVGIWTPGSRQLETSVSIHPNPASESVSVTSSEEIIELEILNLEGQMVCQKTGGNHTLHLDISEFSSGIYLIRVKSMSGMSTQKLVIQ